MSLQGWIKTSAKRVGSALVGVVIAGSSVIGLNLWVPTHALADSDTYSWPDATYVDANYDWGYSTCPGNDTNCMLLSGYKSGTKYGEADPWVYYLRNCTSYVAEKVSQIFGANVSGWKDAYQWHTYAKNANYTLDTTPQKGDIADWGSEVGGGYGHVAYVYDVDSNGIASLDEYNVAGTGQFTTNRTTASNSAGPADWYIHIGTIPTPPPPPPTTYPLALSSNYDETTGLTEVFSGDQKNNMLRETSWLYGQTPQTVSISASISGNIVDIASFVVNGWRHLYTATSTGAVYETVWQAGQSPTTWQVGTVPNVVGIAATYDSSNGLTEVFSIDSSRNIDETYWLYQQTPQTIGIAQLASGTPTSIGAFLYNGYRHVEVSTKEGPITETWWQSNQAASTWQIANVPNAVGVDATMSGTVTEVFTLDSSSRVNETYWDYGQQPQSDVVATLSGTPSDIAAFVTASGYRHVYGSTADTPHAITETWWYPTQAATTWTVTTF